MFTIKVQNVFINQHQRTFLNVTESPAHFSQELGKLKSSLDAVYQALTDSINGLPEPNRLAY